MYMYTHLSPPGPNRRQLRRIFRPTAQHGDLLKTRRALNRHWAFSKKNRIVLLWSFCEQSNKTTKFSPNEPGGRANVFFRYYYVNVTFSSTIRNRRGRNVLVFVFVTLPVRA